MTPEIQDILQLKKQHQNNKSYKNINKSYKKKKKKRITKALTQTDPDVRYINEGEIPVLIVGADLSLEILQLVEGGIHVLRA